MITLQYYKNVALYIFFGFLLYDSYTHLVKIPFFLNLDALSAYGQNSM